MSRLRYLLVALLAGVVVVVVVLLVKASDDPAPSVNAEDIAMDDTRGSARGSPLESRHGHTGRPEPEHPTPAPPPGGSPGAEHVVAGSVTATTGTLPATLSVTARPETGKPQVVQTDDGSFRFEFEEASAVTLTAEADSWYQLEPVTVTVPSAAELKLAPAALLNGRVGGTDGSVVADAQVELTSGGLTVANAKTDGSGRFSFRTLRPAAYRAEVTYGDNQAAESLFVVVGDNAEDITIDVGVELTLRLQDEYGNAIPLTGTESVTLGVYRAGYSAPSRALGAFPGRPGELLWRGLKSAQYSAMIQVPDFERTFVRFEASGPRHVEEVTLKRGGAIAGVVHVSGDLPGGLLQIRTRRDGKMRVVDIDENNRFTIESLSLGKYTVEVVDTSSNRSVASEVVEVAGGTANVTFSVEAGATLTLEFTADGAVAADVRVWVQIWNDEGDRHWANSIDGKAVMGFLKPGTYTVSLVPFGGGFASLETGVVISQGKNAKQIALRKPNCQRIAFVLEGSNAEAAGLKEEDLLLSFAGVAVTSTQALKDAIGKLSEGDTVTMRVARDGEELELNIESWKGTFLGLSTEDAYYE